MPKGQSRIPVAPALTPETGGVLTKDTPEDLAEPVSSESEFGWQAATKIAKRGSVRKLDLNTDSRGFAVLIDGEFDAEVGSGVGDPGPSI